MKDMDAAVAVAEVVIGHGLCRSCYPSMGRKTSAWRKRHPCPRYSACRRKLETAARSICSVRELADIIRSIVTLGG